MRRSGRCLRTQARKRCILGSSRSRSMQFRSRARVTLSKRTWIWRWQAEQISARGPSPPSFWRGMRWWTVSRSISRSQSSHCRRDLQPRTREGLDEPSGAVGALFEGDQIDQVGEPLLRVPAQALSDLVAVGVIDRGGFYPLAAKGIRRGEPGAKHGLHDTTLHPERLASPPSSAMLTRLCARGAGCTPAPCDRQ